MDCCLSLSQERGAKRDGNFVHPARPVRRRLSHVESSCCHLHVVRSLQTVWVSHIADRSVSRCSPAETTKDNNGEHHAG